MLAALKQSYLLPAQPDYYSHGECIVPSELPRSLTTYRARIYTADPLSSTILRYEVSRVFLDVLTKGKGGKL
jgi:hypothetical protein